VLFRLALRNMQRNWYRTLLAVVGMALAAASLTGALSMNSGYPEGRELVYRQFMEADLVVYPGRVSLEGARLEGSTRDTEWQWSDYPGGPASDLSFFHPRMVREGLLTPTEDVGEVLTPELLEELGQVPGVVEVIPYRVYPAFIERDGKYYAAPLRARDIDLDQELGFDQRVTRGRYFSRDDHGELRALVNGARPGRNTVYGFVAPAVYGERLAYEPPKVDSWIDITVPSITRWVDGRPVYDFGNMKELSFQVIGQFSLPTHVEAAVVSMSCNPEPLEHGALDLPTGSPPRFDVQAYWETPQLLVPAATIERLYMELGGTQPTVYYQAGVVLDNVFHAKKVAETIRQRFTDLTVFTVPEQVERARSAAGQSAVPADLSKLVGILAVMTAGLIVAANMYVVVTERRREIGIYKALGMSSWEILVLILLEAVGLGLLGGLIGFGFIQLLVTGMLAVSSVALGQAVAITLSTMAQVLGLTLATSVLFGLFPAMEAARATTMEVLRQDA